jgi:hypothetical protein
VSSAVEQHLFRPAGLATAEIVAEAVVLGLEHGVGLRVGLVLRRVGAAGGEGHGDVVAGRLGRLFDGGRAAEHDQVGERDALGAGLGGVEVGLDGFQFP